MEEKTVAVRIYQGIVTEDRKRDVPDAGSVLFPYYLSFRTDSAIIAVSILPGTQAEDSK